MSKAYTSDKGLGLIVLAIANCGGFASKREIVREMIRLRGDTASPEAYRGRYMAYFGDPERVEYPGCERWFAQRSPDAERFAKYQVADYRNGVYYTRPRRGFYRLTPAGEKLVKALREDCASC